MENKQNIMNIGMLWANLSLDILPSNITNCKAYTLDDFDMIFVVHYDILLSFCLINSYVIFDIAIRMCA